MESFANIERTTDGGTHVQGLLLGLGKGLLDAAPTWKTVPPKKRAAAIDRGLHAIVCVRLNDPTFGAPTKSRLDTPEAKKAVSQAIRAASASFLRHHPAVLEHLAGKP